MLWFSSCRCSKKTTFDFGCEENGFGCFKLSISMAEIETPSDGFFWSEAIGIRKSLPTTNGWPLLLCLFWIGRRWTIRGGYFRRNLQKIDCKNAKDMFMRMYQCQFSQRRKVDFLGTCKGIRILVATFSCASKNSCSLTFFTKLYQIMFRPKLWANSPNHLHKRSQGALWI